MGKHGFLNVFMRENSKQEKVQNHPVTAAVIVAAGNSTRMGVPKQLIPIRGIPVIGRTLLAFEASELVDEIVLVTREEDLLHFYDICKTYQITKVTKILKGGSTRQQSVREGVMACRDTTEFFAIHDGARPMISPPMIEAVIEAAYQCGAAAAGVKVKDTIKQTDEKGFITATPDRSFLWNVQTPQVFERKLYLQSLNAAFTADLDLTDDCQLVERMQHRVQLVESSYANIKITTPEDVAFAEAMLLRGENDGMI